MLVTLQRKGSPPQNLHPPSKKRYWVADKGGQGKALRTINGCPDPSPNPNPSPPKNNVDFFPGHQVSNLRPQHCILGGPGGSSIKKPRCEHPEVNTFFWRGVFDCAHACAPNEIHPYIQICRLSRRSIHTCIHTYMHTFIHT